MMSDKARRKELAAEYKHMQPEAGVYRIVNGKTGKALLASSSNVASVRSKIEFAKSTQTSGLFFLRLRDDIRAFGLDAFSLEILEVLDTDRDMTREEIARDLAALEELWREKFDPALLY